MGFTVIIPARYASTRLPGKPLLDLCGKPLIQRVYECATQSGAATVAIATDFDGIATRARDFGARVIMTSAQHTSGTERTAEAAAQMGLADGEIVVNLQGDEPMMPPAVIDQVAGLLATTPRAEMATVCERIREARDVFDPNVVKVAMGADGRALYFSRAPIPWARETFGSGASATLPPGQTYYRHIGLYAYRVGYLQRYARLPRCELEATEALEQLRALHHDACIVVAEACTPTGFGIDTAADAERVRALLGGDRAVS